jgi:hypothetical protein
MEGECPVGEDAGVVLAAEACCAERVVDECEALGPRRAAELPVQAAHVLEPLPLAGPRERSRPSRPPAHPSPPATCRARNQRAHPNRHVILAGSRRRALSRRDRSVWRFLAGGAGSGGLVRRRRRITPMCAACAMAAAAGATGARSWLQAQHMTWLTPRRMRVATATLVIAAAGTSTIGLSGSSKPPPRPVTHQAHAQAR